MELSYKALLLELPSLSNILLGKNDIDINLYAEALDTLKYTIAHQYKEKFLKIYAKHHQPNNQSLDAVSIGKRAVKNLALSMLGELKDETIMQMAKEQYYNSLNMGDKLNALKVIDSINHFESEEEFRDFYNRYKDNQLLMVKYFSIKASLDDEFVLQRIIELEKDKLFNKKVPNLVRALYATFARNLKQFHNLNAKGYEFIAQKILMLDTINPQMAASLANSFKLYPKLQKKYQNLMQKEMAKILKNDAISDNTYEILSKINYTEKLKN
jgi:aminopeptidase N